MGSEVDSDLVILDLNLPGLDGVAVLRHLRLRRPSLPVLVLILRSSVEDRAPCLDTGADDYLPKPFSFRELSARIRALLRQSHLPSESVLVVEDLKLDRVKHRVERAGRRIELIEGVYAPRKSDAECREASPARRDHRSSLEPHFLYQHQWGGCLYLWTVTECAVPAGSGGEPGIPSCQRHRHVLWRVESWSRR